MRGSQVDFQYSERNGHIFYHPRYSKKIEFMYFKTRRMLKFRPKFWGPDLSWRTTVSNLLTKYIQSDIAQICVQYIFVPAGKSCSDVCKTINIGFIQIMSGNFHLNRCPVSPDMCYRCARYICEDNKLCSHAHYHEYVHMFYILCKMDSIEPHEYMQSRREHDQINTFRIITDAYRRLVAFGIVSIAACALALK